MLTVYLSSTHSSGERHLFSARHCSWHSAPILLWLQSHNQRILHQSDTRPERLCKPTGRIIQRYHNCGVNTHTNSHICDNDGCSTGTHSARNNSQLREILPSTNWRLLPSRSRKPNHLSTTIRGHKPRHRPQM